MENNVENNNVEMPSLNNEVNSEANNGALEQVQDTQVEQSVSEETPVVDVASTDQTVGETPVVDAAPTDQQAEGTPAVDAVSTKTPVEETPVVFQEASEQQVKREPKVKEEVIYEMKKDKGPNPFGVIFFFAIILAAVYFLPEIYSNIGSFIPGLGSQEETINKKKGNGLTGNGSGDKETTKYSLNSNVSDAKLDDLSFGNFIKLNENGYKLNFYIINNKVATFTFDQNTKFFLDLYQGYDYIGSLLVFSYEPIGSKDTKDFSLDITKDMYDKADSFAVVRKKSDDYPDVEIKNFKESYKVITCTKNRDVMSYYFNNVYLEKIEENIKETNVVSTYAADLQYYKGFSAKYQNIAGIDYNIIETQTDFNAITNIDLSKIDDTSLYRLATYKFFGYHVESKIVAFEMKALGYTCS